MSHLTAEELTELTERINARIAEFKVAMMPTVTPGIVRIAVDEINRWHARRKAITHNTKGEFASDSHASAGGAKDTPANNQAGKAFFAELEAARKARLNDVPKLGELHDDEVKAEIVEHESTISVATPLPDGSRNGVEKYSSTSVTRNDSAMAYAHQEAIDALRDMAGLRIGGRGRQGKQELEEEADELEEDDLEDDDEMDDDNADDTKPKRKRPYSRRGSRRRLMGYEQAQPLSPGRRGKVLPTLDDLIAEVRDQAMGGVMPTQATFNDAKPDNWATATAHLTRLGISWDELAELAGLQPQRVRAGVEA